MWKVLLAAVPVGLLVAAAVNVWLSARNERRRTQPVLIAHEVRGAPFAGELGGWVYRSYLTNEGGGPAFNARSGIRIGRHRFPFRGVKDGKPILEGRASRWRVVAVGERLPSDGGIPIVIDSVTMVGLRKSGKREEKRVHWCRYENAYGHTWETRNPVDPAANMTIHRVLLPRFREWREGRRLKALHRRGLALDERLREELLAAMESGAAEQTAPKEPVKDPPA